MKGKAIIPIVAVIVLISVIATAFVSSAITSNQLSYSPNSPAVVATASTVTAAASETDSMPSTPTVVIDSGFPGNGYVGTEKSAALLVANPNGYDTSGFALVITFTGSDVASCYETSTGCFEVLVESPQISSISYQYYMDQCEGTITGCPVATSTAISYYADLNGIPPGVQGASVVTVSAIPLATGTFGFEASIVSNTAGAELTPAAPVAGTAAPSTSTSGG